MCLGLEEIFLTDPPLFAMQVYNIKYIQSLLSKKKENVYVYFQESAACTSPPDACMAA